MKLVLVRHGQTEWNEQHRTQGHRDSPLTPKGLGQADDVGRALSTLSPKAFFCSDVGRAVQTAERIAGANPGFPPVRLDPRLRELDYGQWEGLTRAEIQAGFADLYHTYRSEPEAFRAPNGESFQDLQQRFLSFAGQLSPESGGTVLAVTHSGVIRIALVSLTGRPVSQLWAGPSVVEASVWGFLWDRGRWTIEPWTASG